MRLRLPCISLLQPISSNYHNVKGNESKKASALLAGAMKKEYSEALKAHTDYYQSQFNRVSLSLGGENTKTARQETVKRIAGFSQGNDPALAALMFQYLPLPADFFFTAGRTACQFARHLESSVECSVGWKVYHQYQYRNELLAAEVTNLSETQIKLLFGLVQDFICNRT